MRGISVGKPREPSVLGMIILSTLVGLAFSSNVDKWGILMALLGVFINIITFDSTMNSLRTRKYSNWVFLMIINAVPYLVGLIYWKAGIMVPYVVAATILFSHVLLVHRLDWRSPANYIWGASIPVLPGIFVPALSGGSLTWKAWTAWFLLSIYAMSTAAYVETRLAYRKTNPVIPLAVLAPSVVSLIRAPCLIIALLEPFIKVLSNIRGRRVVAGVEEIKRMGRIETLRLYIFAFLMVIILKIMY